MSVLNSEDRDGCDLAPIHSAAGPHRDGVVGQNQDQPLRPVEVQRELPLSAPLQLVKPPWSIAEVLQDRWRNDAVQPPADQLGSMLATGLPQELEIIAFLLELRALKAHLQGATLDKIAGDREKGARGTPSGLPGSILPSTGGLRLPKRNDPNSIRKRSQSLRKSYALTGLVGFSFYALSKIRDEILS